uniref:Uncharacterized protein n=1 Tax=Eutreptiella gymnastica TaxID=73025 RepID=A0A7S4FWW8_9EUGL
MDKSEGPLMHEPRFAAVRAQWDSIASKSPSTCQGHKGRTLRAWAVQFAMQTGYGPTDPLTHRDALRDTWRRECRNAGQRQDETRQNETRRDEMR